MVDLKTTKWLPTKPRRTLRISSLFPYLHPQYISNPSPFNSFPGDPIKRKSRWVQLLYHCYRCVYYFCIPLFCSFQLDSAEETFTVFYVLFVNAGNESQVVTSNNTGCLVGAVIWDSYIGSFRFTPSLHHDHSTLSYKLPRPTHFLFLF